MDKATIRGFNIATCSCGCGLQVQAMLMFWGDDSKPYLNKRHYEAVKDGMRNQDLVDDRKQDLLS